MKWQQWGVPYFSSAGNSAREAWVESSGFRPSMVTGPGGGTLHDFDSGAGEVTTLTLNLSSGTFSILLLWDEPFASASPGGAGCSSDVDFHVTDGLGTTISASSTTNNLLGDAIEILSLTNNNPGTFGLQIEHKSGPMPGYLKIQFFFRTGTFFKASKITIIPPLKL